MECANLSVYVCDASEKACEKYGPFSCPSERSELTNHLPKLFEARDQLIDNAGGLSMKMPHLAGERNVVIVCSSQERDGSSEDFTVLAVNNLPDVVDSLASIRDLIRQMAGDLLPTDLAIDYSAALQTINGEYVDTDRLEEYLNGDILICMVSHSSGSICQPRNTCSSFGEETSMQNRPLSGFNPQMEMKTPDDTPPEGYPPPVAVSANSPTMYTSQEKMRYSSLGDKVGDVGLTFVTPVSETNGESDLTRDESQPSSPGSDNMYIDSLLSSDSEDKFSIQEAQAEDTTAGIHLQRNDTELPTVRDILDCILHDKTEKEFFRRAFYESFIFQERGGWIFYNPDDPKKIKVKLAPKSASESFDATDTTTPSIDLNDILSDVKPGYVLVANFHTHPLNRNEEPSKADIENAFHRGMPGIVISRRNIYGYGPERRTNTDKPLEYAPPVSDGKSTCILQKSKVLESNPFRLPYI